MTANDALAPPRSSNRYVVLAAIDDSAAAETVIHQAAELAAKIPDAELHIAHVVDTLGVTALVLGGSPLALPGAVELLHAAKELLKRHCASAQLRVAHPVVGHLRVGPPRREIVQLATNLEVDLLVVGTRDAKGIERLFLGSRTELIARAAPCPVLIARPKAAHRPDVPEILPPCPDCLTEQRASAGKRLWCARHAEHHAAAHVYSETPESFALGAQSYRDS